MKAERRQVNIPAPKAALAESLAEFLRVKITELVGDTISAAAVLRGYGATNAADQLQEIRRRYGSDCEISMTVDDRLCIKVLVDGVEHKGITATPVAEPDA